MAIREKAASIRKMLFGDSARAFGTLGVVLLLLLAIVPARDFFREWYRYQKGYLRLIRGRDDAITLQRRFEGRHPSDLDSRTRRGGSLRFLPCGVERSQSAQCRYPALPATPADPAFVGRNGLRNVPPRPGCGHHRGRGAPQRQGIRGPDGAGALSGIVLRPMSHGQANRNAATERRPHAAGALRLCPLSFDLCCPDGVKLAPTDDPPSLQHIADKTTREWIFAWIKNPQAYSGTATMPNFQLKDDDARDISAFLIAQSTMLSPAAAAPASAAAPDAAALQAGASMYGESFCASCHAIQNAAGLLVGGNVGPELTRIGTKAKPDWLRAWIRNPKGYDPETLMPHYRFDEKQLLTDRWVSGEQNRFRFHGKCEARSGHARQSGARETAGRLKWDAPCATRSTASTNLKISLRTLTAVGSRPLARIVFLPEMPRTLAAYMEAKIKNHAASVPP